MRIANRVNTAMLFLIATALAPAAVDAAELTARQGLDQAQQAIRTWQADATLTRVDTTVLKTDGTARMWQYSFLSPATATCARVILLAGGEPRIQELGDCAPAPPLAAGFVDSPVMLKAAVSAGFKPDEESSAYLASVHDAAAPERECWVVHTFADFDPEQAYMRGWCVDPATGEFVVRLSGHR